MVKFPEPPSAAALAAIPPIIHAVSGATRLWRIYFSGGVHPIAWNNFRHYGPISTSRFDAHHPPSAEQDRGILYGAVHGETTFAECFQETRVIDRRRRAPWLVAFDLGRPVTLLDLTGSWPTRAGASIAINSGPRSRARRWSQRIYEAFPRVEGLWYASSMDGNRPAVALYERAMDAIPGRPVFHRALADPALDPIVIRAAERFNYGIIG